MTEKEDRMSDWVCYEGMSPVKASEFRHSLQQAGAPFICGDNGITYAMVGGLHVKTPDRTIGNYGGRWRHSVKPLEDEPSPCGRRWVKGSTGRLRHPGVCNSCKRLASNGKSEEPATSEVMVAVSPDASVTSVTMEIGTPTTTANETLGVLKAIESAALHLAEQCDEVHKALSSLGEFEQRMKALKDEYEAAMAKVREQVPMA